LLPIQTRLPRFARNDGFEGGDGRPVLRKEKKIGITRLPRFARNDGFEGGLGRPPTLKCFVILSVAKNLYLAIIY
jgi:hypothetical protein